MWKSGNVQNMNKKGNHIMFFNLNYNLFYVAKWYDII
jgi:hypothetical protein